MNQGLSVVETVKDGDGRRASCPANEYRFVFTVGNQGDDVLFD